MELETALLEETAPNFEDQTKTHPVPNPPRQSKGQTIYIQRMELHK